MKLRIRRVVNAIAESIEKGTAVPIVRLGIILMLRFLSLFVYNALRGYMPPLGHNTAPTVPRDDTTLEMQIADAKTVPRVNIKIK